MDKKQIKESLAQNRPWVSQPAPEEAEANHAASGDPALAEFRREREAFNRGVHEKLNQIPVPPGLRDKILAGRKVVKVPVWREPEMLWALAACLVAVASAVFYWARPIPEDTSIAGFRNRMTGFALREYRMDVLTNNLPALKTFLAAKGGPAQFALPAPLARIPLKGGARLTWQNQPVSMVCFDWNKAETLYMFVLSQPLTNSASGAPQIDTVKKLSTATWTGDGLTFLLAGHIPANTLADLIKP